jgi:hypothetical protein
MGNHWPDSSAICLGINTPTDFGSDAPSPSLCSKVVNKLLIPRLDHVPEKLGNARKPLIRRHIYIQLYSAEFSSIHFWR